MKIKLPDGTYKVCPDCKKKFSSNDCETHIPPRKQECYTCHLLEEHIFEWEKDTKSNDKAELGDGGNI